MLPSFTEVKFTALTQFIQVCHVKIEKEFWCLFRLLIKIVRGAQAVSLSWLSIISNTRRSLV